MAELDPADLATVLDAAERYLDSADWDGAYNLLHPISDGNVVTESADIARLNFSLGEACMGLGSNDAAMMYYQVALSHQTGMDAETTQFRIDALGTYDAAVDASANGVAGESEALTVLQAAQRALERLDYEEARGWFQHAWAGIQLTESQMSAAAMGLAQCALQAGELDQAEGYLQVAEARSDGHAETIDVLRQHIGARRAGTTLGADGVQMTELDEINQSALQASWDGDYANAQRLFEQMLASDVLPATDRGRLHRNIGVMQIYLHDYEGARASFEEALRVGTPDIQSLAQASLAQLDANATADDIVAGIDLSAN
jgi:tetratricopeptide (TPR) repeat protein